MGPWRGWSGGGGGGGGGSGGGGGGCGWWGEGEGEKVGGKLYLQGVTCERLQTGHAHFWLSM